MSTSQDDATATDDFDPSTHFINPDIVFQNELMQHFTDLAKVDPWSAITEIKSYLFALPYDPDVFYYVECFYILSHAYINVGPDFMDFAMDALGQAEEALRSTSRSDPPIESLRTGVQRARESYLALQGDSGYMKQLQAEHNKAKKKAKRARYRRNLKNRGDAPAGDDGDSGVDV